MSLYNELVQDHYRHPRNLGHLGQATASARTVRGDTMLEFHVRISGGYIQAASFRAIGCAGTVAAGSAMTEWLIGRSVAEARTVTAQHVLKVLQGLPEERHYCAALAAETILAVLSQ
ncbi:MAG: iron-sulfur cluster assembly scaffold protein [Ardenticatenales bacterium]|nr:iron-sulfur cluster assembly scaffold protein [Ardenticatenales bacterium]